MTTPSANQLDQATISLIFALRDSLTDSGPSRLDFWTGGRGITALQTAAAGASTGHEALTIAARKLQIPQLTPQASKPAVKATELIDEDFQAWARHIQRNAVAIFALANVIRQERKATKTAAKAENTESTEEIPF